MCALEAISHHFHLDAAVLDESWKLTFGDLVELIKQSLRKAADEEI